MSSPFLHLGSRNIDTVGLAATAHGEVDIKGGEALAQVTLGDDVEGSRVVKDVVIEGEVTARIDQPSVDPCKIQRFGMRNRRT